MITQQRPPFARPWNLFANLMFRTRTRLLVKTGGLLLAALATALVCAATDVNQATPAELDSVNGIGPGVSAKILQERKKASFKDWADLEKRVPGIKDKRAVRLSDAGLTVNGASYATAMPAAMPAASAPLK